MFGQMLFHMLVCNSSY